MSNEILSFCRKSSYTQRHVSFDLRNKTNPKEILLHKWLNQGQFEILKNYFNRCPDKQLNYNAFRNLLANFEIYFTNNEYQLFWIKMKGSLDDQSISWFEFISYLDLEYRTYNPINVDDLDLAITKRLKIKLSEHRKRIVGISHYSSPLKAESSDGKSDMYITVSKDGGISFWDLDLNVKQYYSPKSDFVKATQSTVTAVQTLSNFEIFAVSSLDQKIRFYKITTTYLNLLFIISFPYTVSSMTYYTPKTNSEENTDEGASRLVLGDQEGYIRLIEIHEELKKAKSILSWNDLVKGKVPAITVKEFQIPHTRIHKVYYWQDNIGRIISASAYYSSQSSHSLFYPGLIVTDIRGNCCVFNVPKGVTCFWIDTKTEVIATGGPDTFLRLWRPCVTNKPLMILSGHLACICSVFIQTEYNKIYSLDLKKVIKIWNMKRQTLIQTFNEFSKQFPKHELFSTFYNDNSHELIAAVEEKLISIECYSKIDLNQNDGYTSNTKLSVILYNERYQNIITCDYNGNILVWDIITGLRQNYIKNAHKIKINHESTIVGVKISAGCFNTKMNYLLTGDVNGIIKIWNYNMAVCIKKLILKPMNEVTAVFWFDRRILCMGHNGYIKEFSDDFWKKEITKWNTSLSSEIIKATIRLPQTIATGSVTGQLILWNLETGHGYQQYNVNTVGLIEKDSSKDLQEINTKQLMECKYYHNCSITAMIFLNTRPMSPIHGTLLVALSSGNIQIYSHHRKGSYMKEFKAIHKINDCIVSMETDPYNEFLFTGTSFGYIKTWLMLNYCIPEEEKQKISIPSYRLKFIFLANDFIQGRAKFVVKKQPYPILLNSFRGHLLAINSLVYINSLKILLSGSEDKTCRLWSLEGRYLALLGTVLPWNQIFNYEIASTANDDKKIIHTYRIPADIKKVASMTTLRVLTNTYTDRWKELKGEMKETVEDEEKQAEGDMKKHIDEIYKCGKPLTKPILGKYFKLPEPTRFTPPITLDTSYKYIPIYTHLKIYPIEPITKLPENPEIVKKIKELEFR